MFFHLSILLAALNLSLAFTHGHAARDFRIRQHLENFKKTRDAQRSNTLEADLIPAELNADMIQEMVETAPLIQPDASNENDDECYAMPNRTRSQPSFFQCSADTTLTLHGGAITNLSGDDKYPIPFTAPIRVFLDVTSTSMRRFDNLGVEVTLYKRSTGWFGCGWMFLPTFGLLSNYDMCNDNPSCPISPGRQVLEFVLDPTRTFSRLFRLIHDDNSSYQLEVRIRDNRHPYKELLCATLQTRVHL